MTWYSKDSNQMKGIKALLIETPKHRIWDMQFHLTDKISLKLVQVWFRPSQRRYREKSASCECSSWGWWGKEKDCQHVYMPKSNKTAGQIWTPHQPPRGQMESKKILWSFDRHLASNIYIPLLKAEIHSSWGFPRKINVLVLFKIWCFAKFFRKIRLQMQSLFHECNEERYSTVHRKFLCSAPKSKFLDFGLSITA